MSTAKNLTPLILGITNAANAADPAIPEMLRSMPGPVRDSPEPSYSERDLDSMIAVEYS